MLKYFFPFHYRNIKRKTNKLTLIPNKNFINNLLEKIAKYNNYVEMLFLIFNNFINKSVENSMSGKAELTLLIGARKLTRNTYTSSPYST